MTEQSGQFVDQSGNPISEAQLFANLSEAILANVIACESAGIPREHIRMIVGRDGGTIIGDGMMFQTPVTTPLSEEQGRRLFDAFARLYGEYEANRLPATQLARIRTAHNVAHKEETIRNARSAR